MLPIPLILAAAATTIVASPQPPAAPRIVIDARFEDWDAVKPLLVDATDAPAAFVDLGEVRITADDNFVHLLIDFGRTINAQGLDGTADIVLNADGDETTGHEVDGVKGADLIVRCTPPPPNVDHPGSPGRGIGIASTTYTPDRNDVSKPALNIYDVGLAFAPTHAGRRMEFRLARGVMASLNPPTALPALFTGPSFTGKVVFRALDGSIADETDAFSAKLPPRPPTATTQADDAGQASDPLQRGEAAPVRIMNWNAELGAIISRPEPFIRTIDAIAPDVILLQELTNKITEEQLKEFLSHLRPDVTDRPWRIVLGKGGGDLHCAVLSKLPLEAVAPLEIVAYPDRPDRSIRVAAAVIDIDGRKLLATSIHLKCCGRNGSPEDVTRLAEVDLIRKAMQTAIEQVRPEGIIIAGDFNLVGSREPLENMMTGLDLDASMLEAVDAYQIDGRSNATWADRRQPFAAGRLDYSLYSDSSLRPVKCFVYDAWDLAPKWRTEHATHPEDTDAASDHLPVVYDLTWIK